MRRSGCLQIPQADQVIGRGGESELPIDEWDAAMPELAQTTDGLHPPKDLFHEFSFPLTHVITRMPGGPALVIVLSQFFTLTVVSATSSTSPSAPYFGISIQSPGATI